MAITKAEIERRLRALVGNRLYEAARLNDVDLLRAELGKGRSLNQQRPGNGFTPLHTAALNGSVEFLRVALQAKHADPWIQDSKGRLALDHAEVRRDREAMRLLFDAMYPNGRVRFAE